MLKTLLMDKKGEGQTNPLLLLGVLFLAGAIVVVAVFILALSRKDQKEIITEQEGGQSIQTDEQEESSPAGQANEQTAANKRTLRGVLTSLQESEITLTEKNTQTKYSITLNSQTITTHNGAPFDRARFYQGDELEVLVQQAEAGLLAERITVLVSASPATPAPTPSPANVRPDGSIKPL